MLILQRENDDSEKGFVLLYILIALSVVSILMVPFLKAKDLQKTIANLNQTFGVLEPVKGELEKYAMKNGYYPLPADPTLLPDDPDYGKSLDPADFQPDCMGGTETENNVKCRSAAGGGYVLIGMIPVTSLGMNSDQGLDQYGRKLTYAVTKALTEPGALPARDTNGAIILRNPGGSFHADAPQPNLHYMIVNHGENGCGAYVGNTRWDTLDTCPSPSNLERINYDDNHIFVALESNGDIDAAPNKAAGNNYYDDGVAYESTIYGTLWKVMGPQETFLTSDRGTGRLALPTVGTGILTFGSQPASQLHVEGNARIRGDLRTSSLCWPDYYHCLRTENLTTTKTGMEGAPIKCRFKGTGLTKITYNPGGINNESIALNCDTKTIAPNDFPGNPTGGGGGTPDDRPGNCSAAGAIGLRSTGELICVE